MSDRVAHHLRDAGADAGAARNHARALEAIVQEHGVAAPPERQFVVPGRIEVLGKHTDYAGGNSVTCASARGIRIVAAPRGDGFVCLHEPQLGRFAALEAGPGAEAHPGHWSGYAAAVIRRIARNAPGRLRGADLWLSSDLPRAAGMSSSSAFMIAVLLGLDAVCDLRACRSFADALPDAAALAGYAASIENGTDYGDLVGERGVGTLGGSEDHVAILLSRPGHVGRYRYAPFEALGRAPLPADHVFVVAASGVSAKKTGSAREAYNEASRLASDTARAWMARTGEPTPHLGALLDRHPDANLADASLQRRLDHFRIEDREVIPAAWEALAAGNLERFGDAVDRSQAAADALLGNQVPVTNHLAASARRLGAVAASAFGAGFGGSVWAMVPASEATAFTDRWRTDYARAFPGPARRARFFVDATGPGALRADGHPVWERRPTGS